MKAFIRCLLSTASLVGILASVSGCKTGDEDLSGRPWNAPKTWESGIPSSMTEGR
jgi:hypothetical protein